MGEQRWEERLTGNRLCRSNAVFLDGSGKEGRKEGGGREMKDGRRKEGGKEGGRKERRTCRYVEMEIPSPLPPPHFSQAPHTSKGERNKERNEGRNEGRREGTNERTNERTNEQRRERKEGKEGI